MRMGLLDVLCFLLVAAYLCVVFVFLLVTRRLRPPVSLQRILRASLRPKQKGKLEVVQHEGGHCYCSQIDPRLISETEGWSRVVVYEDGRPLPRPRVFPQLIRKEGRGAYSHWLGIVYFSSTDNSDPRTNQRTYTFAEV